MMTTILSMVFGCSHNNYGFPMTQKKGQRRTEAAKLTGTYVVCLDCGKEFAYDWQEMKIIINPEQAGRRLAEPAHATE